MVKTKDKNQKLVSYMMYFVGIGMPFTTVPQIRQMFTTQVATGLSLSTWVMYLVFSCVPLAYAYSNKLKPLIISNILWVFVDIVMIYGIIRYSPGLLPGDFGTLLAINNAGKALNGMGLILLSLAALFFAIDLNNLKQQR